MDRATQALRTLAVITLVICVATVLYQVSLLTSVTSAYAIYQGFTSMFSEFAWITCSALGIATGVAAIVIAAQHHHRRWLLGLLIPTVITPYGPLVVPLVAPRVIFGASGIDSYVRLETLNYTALPFVTALVVFAYCLYCLRSRRSFVAPPPSDDSNLELEYSRLN